MVKVEIFNAGNELARLDGARSAGWVAVVERDASTPDLGERRIIRLLS